MAETIAQLKAIIGADITGFMSGLSTVSAQLTKFGASLTMLTAPLAAFGVQGVKVAASFEDLMVQLKTFGGVAGKELEQVRSFVLKMGADTVFSAQDAGSALLDMLKSGMSLKDGMAGLPTVLQLATVGSMSLSEASGIVTAAMAQYGLTAKDATRITNALAQGANASRADVKDLGAALQNVGPIAKQFGLSVEDTVAILSVFANNGIMGAEAGTQLKSMLLNLSRPTDKVQEAYSALGVTLYDNTGKMKNLNVFIKELDAALSKLPVKKQNELMQTLGGTYGILGLSALRASKGTDTMLKAMKAAPGAATVAEASMGTFSRAVESLKGSLETLQITVLTPLMENILKPLVNWLIEITNKVSAWAAANPELANTITMILAGLTLLGPTIMALGVVIGPLVNGLALVGTLIGALTSPIGLVIVGIGALAAAFATNFGGIRDTLQPIITEIGNLINSLFGGGDQAAAANPLAGAMDELINGPMEAFAKVGSSGPLSGLKDTFAAIGQVVNNSLLPALRDVQKFFTELWGIVGPELGKLATWFVGDALPGVITFINTKVIPAIGGVINMLRDIWNTVSPGLIGLARWFIADGMPFIKGILDDFNTLVLTPAITALRRIWEIVGPPLNDLKTWFETEFPKIGEQIEALIAPMREFIDLYNSVRGKATVGDVKKGAGLVEQMPGMEGIGGLVRQILGNTLGFAAGGPVMKPTLATLGERGQEYVVPSGGALVMRGNGGGGYNGPSVIHVILKADNFEDHIYANVAEGIAG